MRILLLIAAIYGVVFSAANAQTIAVLQTDTLNDTILQSRFACFDKQDRRVFPSLFDVIITENGIPRPILSFSCGEPPTPISAVICIDVSTSMQHKVGNIKALELAKETARAWIRTLPAGSECAIMSFEYDHYIVRNLLSDTTELFIGIEDVQQASEAVVRHKDLGYPAGEILKNGRYKQKRIVVFSNNPDVKSISGSSNNGYIPVAGVIVGSNSIGNPRISSNFVENIATVESIQYATTLLNAICFSENSCTVKWIISKPEKCVENYVRIFSIQGIDDTIRTEFTITKRSPSFGVSPNYFKFGIRPAGIPVTDSLSIYSGKESIIFYKIVCENPSFSIKEQSLEVSAGSVGYLHLTYTPFDSVPVYAKIALIRECDTVYAYISGGAEGKFTPNTTALRVLSPNGGEKLLAGERHGIAWDGISRLNDVEVGYSTDNGANWKEIYHTPLQAIPKWYQASVEQGAGFTPNKFEKSSHCRARIRQVKRENIVQQQFSRIGNISGFPGATNATAISPDGKTLAMMSSGIAVVLWDVETGRCKGILPEMVSQSIGQFQFSPDSKYLSVTAYHRNLDFDITFANIWDIESKKVIDRRERSIYYYNNKPSGSMILTAWWNQRFEFYIVQDGCISGNYNSYCSNKFSGVSTNLQSSAVVVTQSDSTIIFLDAETLQPRQTIKTVFPVSSPILSEDGLLLSVISNGKRIILYTLTGEKYIESSDNKSPMLFGSSEVKYVEQINRDTLAIWDKKNSNKLYTFKGALLAYSGTLGRVYDARYILCSRAENIIICDAETGDSIRPLQTLWDVATPIISKDRKEIIFSGSNGRVETWDIASGKKVREQIFFDSIVGRGDYPQVSPDQTKLILDYFERPPVVWDIVSKKILYSLPENFTATFSPDGQYIITSDSLRTFWKIDDGSKAFTLLGKGIRFNPQNFLLSSNGRFLATIITDSTGYDSVLVWDIAKSKLMWNNPKNYKIRDLKFSNDGDFLTAFMYSEWASVKVWNSATGELLYNINIDYLYEYGSHDLFGKYLIATSQDNSRLAIAGITYGYYNQNNTTIPIINLKTGTVEHELLGHTIGLSALEFIDNDHLFSCDRSNYACVWNLAPKSVVLQEDISDFRWSITAPKPILLSEIQFGNTAVGGNKDSLIRNAAVNNDNDSVNYYRMYFTGENSSDFSVTTSRYGYLQAYSALDIGINFHPSDSGLRTATLLIITPTDTLTCPISGMGFLVPIRVKQLRGTDYLGTLDLANSFYFDKIDIPVVWNFGSAPVTVHFRTDKPNAAIFQLLSATDVLLSPGDTGKISVRFIPNDTGRISGRILIEFDGIDSPMRVALHAEAERKTISEVENIPERYEYNEYSVRPIPAEDAVELEYTSESEEIAIIAVYSMSGEIVTMPLQTKVVRGSNSIHLDIHKLPAGMYRIGIEMSGKHLFLPLPVVR